MLFLSLSLKRLVVFLSLLKESCSTTLLSDARILLIDELRPKQDDFEDEYEEEEEKNE